MFASLMPDLLGMEVQGPFETARIARRHGFKGVDLRMEKVRIADGDVERFNEALARDGLVQGYCSLGPGRVSVPEGEWRAGIDRLPTVCRLAKSLGYDRAAIVVLPGHDELEFGENEKLHVTRVREMMGVLGDYGLRLGLEYVSPVTRRNGFRHHYIHDLRGALDLIAKVNRAGVGLMLDTFHWHCAGESGEDIRGLTNEQVVVVHVNDAVAGRPVDQQVVMERELPGESGVIDLAAFFVALVDISYDGPVTCEPTHAKWAKMDPEEVLARTSRGIARYISP